jgi:predicted nucleic acid-binding protein
MSLLYLDTSALIKLYLNETGSSWLRTFVTGEQITFSELVLYESATVLRRHYLEGSLTRKQASSLYARLMRNSQAYQVVLLRIERQLPRVMTMAFNLPLGLRLRALDSIHLAAAQVSREAATNLAQPVPFIFVSSDRQLLQAAQALGFTTENPESHP